MKITIFTPTYNRCELLYNLYDSLLSQTSRDFEWLIVDDGSTDDTFSVINKFMEANILDIRYVKVQNGGKHRAINIASDLAKGEYIFIVDNDDTLIPEAIEIGLTHLNNIDSNSEIAGVVFRLKYKNGSLVGDKLPFDNKIDNYFNIRYTLGYNVDFKEFTRVNVLRSYKYPEYLGENFCSEALVWNRISEKFDYLFVDKAIYICEYLDGGLSSSIISNRRNSSSYAMDIYSELFNNKRIPPCQKIKAGINFWRFAVYNKMSFLNKLQMLNFKILGLLLYLPSLIVVSMDSYKLKKK
ncbi:glycosyltransferase family 2 protein [Sphingobacterium multivorum]|uniref:glycosyltransferase family 2 protein n=1 Tax=Sphingobacterium multivorum TaxID=28454 RepID=UPI003DA5AA1F